MAILVSETHGDKKLEIIFAAIGVMLEKGVGQSSMNDFVTASGFSKGGVYHYFSSKEELLSGVIDYFFSMFQQSLEESDKKFDSPYLKLKSILLDHKEMIAEMGNYNTLFVELFTFAHRIPSLKQKFTAQYKMFQGYIASMIEQGVQRGEFTHDVDPFSIATGVIAIFDGVAIARTVSADSIKYPDYAINNALLILEAIHNE